MARGLRVRRPGATGCLAWLVTVLQVAAQMGEWVQAMAHQQWGFLLLVNLSLFMLGIFIEPLPALPMALVWLLR